MRRLTIAAVATLALLTGASPAHALPPAEPDASAWVPDNGVAFVEHRGGRTIVAGSFHWWGPFTGEALRFAPGDANPAPKAGQAVVSGGDVRVVISDGAGGSYVGGSFSVVNGEPRDGLAHLEADGSLDPAFSTVMNGTVRALALNLLSNTLYVGGHFTQLGQETRRNLGAVNATTGAVSGWAPCTSDNDSTSSDPENDTVIALAASSTTVYVGGDFTGLGTLTGSPASCGSSLQRLNLGSVSTALGAPTSWQPDPDGEVYAVRNVGTTLYVGGDFRHVDSSFSSTGRTNAAAFAAGSNTPTGWFPQPNGPVTSLARDPGGEMILGGAFTALGFVPVARQALARVDGDTGALRGFDAGLPSGSTVDAIALSGSHLAFAGTFTAGANEGLGMADATSGAHQPLDLQPGGAVRALAALADGSIVAGGSFNSAKAVRRSGLAVLDGDGVPTDVTLAPGTWVQAMGVSPDGRTAYLRTAIGNVPQLESRDLVTGAKGQWAPTFPNGATLYVLRASDDGRTVYMGGAFGTISGGPRANLAATDAVTGTVLPWRPDPDGSVLAVREHGDQVYVGGGFQHIGTGADARSYVARVSAATGAADAWSPVLDGTVTSVALSSDFARLFVGGNFTHAGSQPRGYGAALSTVSGNPTPFDPQLSNTAYGIALGGVDDSDVYLRGQFDTAGGYPRAGFAVTGAALGALASWNPMARRYINGVPTAVDGDSAWLGSDYQFFGSYARPGYAQYSTAPALRAAPGIAGAAAVGEALTCTAAGWRNAPATVAVAWLRDDAAIPGAAERTYVATADDAGRQVRCRETAANPGGSGEALSPAVTVAAAPDGGGGGPGDPPPPTGGPSVPVPTPTPPPSVKPKAPKLSLPSRVKASALAKGVTVTVTVAAKGKVTVTAALAAKTVATGSATAKRAGKVTLRLKATASYRKRLRSLRGKTIVVKATAGGASASVKRKLA